MMATITKKKYYQLDHIWETAIKMNGSIVLWKSPRENDKNLLIDLYDSFHKEFVPSPPT